MTAPQRAADYVAIAEAFGVFWSGNDSRNRALLSSFDDPDPDAVLASMHPVAAPIRLHRVVRVWNRAVY
ncbi:hypothetical protein O4220_06310 [Rhodococcus ruber]|uniref:DUF3263 domain-containing protein n=1 Tax=Rhodococcus ruber TaxID=1830 RepID=A0ABT4MC73_9NOCA|nr:hypothetical protein [Rhodococcus ruber]MCZ4518125.1 hypothetical protein [Rhodococcus ruber]